MDAHITRRLRIARPQAPNQGDRGYPRALPSSTSHPRTGERGARLRPARPPPRVARLKAKVPSCCGFIPQNGDVLGASAGGGGDRVRILGAVHLATRGRTIQASARDAAREERRRRDRRVVGRDGSRWRHRRAQPSAREGEEAPRGPPRARGDRARGRRSPISSPPPTADERDGESYDQTGQHTIEHAPRAHPVVQAGDRRPASSSDAAPRASARRTARPPRASASPSSTRPRSSAGRTTTACGWTSLRTSA